LLACPEKSHGFQKALTVSVDDSDPDGAAKCLSGAISASVIMTEPGLHDSESRLYVTI